MAEWEFYEQHFGTVRLRHYVAYCGGDLRRAEELYRWNVAASAAFWGSFAYFEVAFRNALDTRMCARQARLGRPGHWLFDDARELGRDANGPGRHARPYTDIAQAEMRVRRNHKALDPGQVLSEMPFGFWHQMVSRRQMFLWPDLASAFPFAPDRRQDIIAPPIGRLREFRNRIGHHHRIWSKDPAGRWDDLLTVAGFIDPTLRTFIESRSLLVRLLDHTP